MEPAVVKMTLHVKGNWAENEHKTSMKGEIHERGKGNGKGGRGGCEGSEK